MKELHQQLFFFTNNIRKQRKMFLTNGNLAVIIILTAKQIISVVDSPKLECLSLEELFQLYLMGPFKDFDNPKEWFQGASWEACAQAMKLGGDPVCTNFFTGRSYPTILCSFEGVIICVSIDHYCCSYRMIPMRLYPKENLSIMLEKIFFDLYSSHQK